MRIMRPGVATLTAALGAACLLTNALPAQQTDPYPATLYFGTGLITIPVAWVSPRSAETWLNTSAKELPSIANAGRMNTFSRWNTNIALDTHWAGRFSLGAVAYSQNPEYGFFGQLLLLRQGDLGGFMPSLAVGVRNVGPYSHEDRFFVGEDIHLGPDSTYERVVPERYEKFNTAQTLYAVATRDFWLGRPGTNSMSLSLGYGNGLFRDDGDLGDFYNKHGTIAPGLFAGLRLTTHPALNTSLTFMAENDGWDYNAGVLVDWRGLTGGIYLTELEEGGRDPDRSYIYNYRKMNISLGYSGNVVDIANGVILRTRITELTREQQRLRYEIAARNRRIHVLEVALNDAQATELATLEQRRAELEQQVQEERDAVKLAEERLRQLENGQPATPPQAPSSQMPTSPNPPSQSPQPGTIPPAR